MYHCQSTLGVAPAVHDAHSGDGRNCHLMTICVGMNLGGVDCNHFCVGHARTWEVGSLGPRTEGTLQTNDNEDESHHVTRQETW